MNGMGGVLVSRALRAKQVRLSLGALVAVVALAGCGVHPGAAIVVGDTTISSQDVDDAAAGLCASTVASAESQGQPRPQLGTRGARQAAVQLMLDNEISRQFADAEGIEPDQSAVSAALEQNAAAIEAIPAAQRDDFRDLFRGFQESQQIIDAAGRASLEDQGNTNPAPEEISAEGVRLRNQWARGLDVELDPRFGTFANGTVTPTSGSLSIPVSERAAQGANAEPGTEWTAALPASQRC